MISASELERELAAIARLARRLMPPLSRNPHLFHESKAELIEAAEKLRDRVRGVAAPGHSFRAEASTDTHLRSLRVAGRAIPIERVAR